MGKIRVMIVDDAVVVRRLITDALSADPDIEVVGTAPNGRIALQKLTQLQPDVVTMDVEMPEMDGLTALSELRRTHPKLPVIMFSTLTERGGQATLEALARGATDYVTKPANVGSVNEGLHRVREELLPKIRWLAGRGGLPSAPARSVPSGNPAAPAGNNAARTHVPGPGPVPRSPVASRPKREPVVVDVITIGVSTGGPVAIGKVFPRFPRDLPVPVLVVQHMPPVFTRLLADRLAATCQMPVHEGAAGMRVEPGHIYIAPGGYHMVVKRDASGQVVIDTNTDPPENSCRPAVDVLFRSVARVYGGRVLCAVLTGMGHDGMRGAEVIRDAGGFVIAQDEATSVVWGMPGAVVHAGLADEVLPLDAIADALVRRCRPPAQRPLSSVA
ncbi:MAG: chemotaxis response regulator protein-glutamate methylesterase [Tepidisphaerales bacterium]